MVVTCISLASPHERRDVHRPVRPPKAPLSDAPGRVATVQSGPRSQGISGGLCSVDCAPEVLCGPARSAPCRAARSAHSDGLSEKLLVRRNPIKNQGPGMGARPGIPAASTPSGAIAPRRPMDRTSIVCCAGRGLMEAVVSVRSIRPASCLDDRGPTGWKSRPSARRSAVSTALSPPNETGFGAS